MKLIYNVNDSEMNRFESVNPIDILLSFIIIAARKI